MIGLLIFILLFGSSGSSESDNTPEPTPVASETSAPIESKTPEPSIEPSASASPDAPIDFRFGALRDLGDIRKDVKEARMGISADGLGRYYWNVAEIEFNMAQLESMIPREEYATKWNVALGNLRIAVDSLNPDDDSLTVSGAKSALDRVLNKISPLESIAKTIAN